MAEVCPRCNGPAVRVQQDGSLSCARQCDETTLEAETRRELEGLTADLARLVGAHTPKGYGFTLVLSKFGERGCMAYASSVVREDAKSMLQELLDKVLVTQGRAS